jgi:hypothetical protein
MSFAGETLTFLASVKEVRRFDTGEPLERASDGKSFILPVIKGRLLLEIPGFFAAKASRPSRAVATKRK